MFITVRFSKTVDSPEQAENLYEIFNSDCYLCHLAQRIRSQCGCEDSDELVLADESCNLIPITQLALNNGKQNASSLFKERGQYILLTSEKRSNGKLVYHCRLASQFIDVELEDMIMTLSNPELVDARKKKKRTSVQGTKSSGKQSAAAKKFPETARASKLSGEKRKT